MDCRRRCCIACKTWSLMGGTGPGRRENLCIYLLKRFVTAHRDVPHGHDLETFTCWPWHKYCVQKHCLNRSDVRNTCIALCCAHKPFWCRALLHPFAVPIDRNPKTYGLRRATQIWDAEQRRFVPRDKSVNNHVVSTKQLDCKKYHAPPRPWAAPCQHMWVCLCTVDCWTNIGA